MPNIQRICCVCKIVYGEKEVDSWPEEKPRVTHGYCPQCAEEARELVRRYGELKASSKNAVFVTGAGISS